MMTSKNKHEETVAKTLERAVIVPMPAGDGTVMLPLSDFLALLKMIADKDRGDDLSAWSRRSVFSDNKFREEFLRTMSEKTFHFSALFDDDWKPAPSDEADAEDAADIRAYDAAKAIGPEFLTAAEVEALAEAATPMAFWRKKRGMNQSDFARAIGTTQSHISEIETGRSGMSFDTAQRIAKALGVTLDDLAD